MTSRPRQRELGPERRTERPSATGARREEIGGGPAAAPELEDPVVRQRVVEDHGIVVDDVRERLRHLQQLDDRGAFETCHLGNEHRAIRPRRAGRLFRECLGAIGMVRRHLVARFTE